jgi:hypothetical protein
VVRPATADRPTGDLLQNPKRNADPGIDCSRRVPRAEGTARSQPVSQRLRVGGHRRLGLDGADGSWVSKGDRSVSASADTPPVSLRWKTSQRLNPANSCPSLNCAPHGSSTTSTSADFSILFLKRCVCVGFSIRRAYRNIRLRGKTSFSTSVVILSVTSRWSVRT